MLDSFSDLFRKPTFISIVSILLFGLGIPLMIYQYFTFDESSSLGLTIEMIFLLIIFALLVIDRHFVKKINSIKLSIIEVVLITGFLIYYYYTNDKSFSIG
ncbi:hypothetical protein [Chryseobacterium defluvii]|uniref:Uncharacterized protein n=1 Tax=Chryseobacterium defluvii TaxID=160396 RepID=A0A495SEC2_9FLAO|nr:hypothetical protein [Chryseobacterium defluvii]RKS97969.1 hypothetical protein BCF58_2106 [Chryseobacterium defluvii]